MPVIEEYEKEGKLIKINADNCIESVTIDLEKALEL
jgi:adenylate kinase family enzyme